MRYFLSGSCCLQFDCNRTVGTRRVPRRLSLPPKIQIKELREGAFHSVSSFCFLLHLDFSNQEQKLCGYCSCLSALAIYRDVIFLRDFQSSPPTSADGPLERREDRPPALVTLCVHRPLDLERSRELCFHRPLWLRACVFTQITRLCALQSSLRFYANHTIVCATK